MKSPYKENLGSVSHSMTQNKQIQVDMCLMEVAIEKE